MNNLKDILDLIKEKNIIGITFHQSPDGDSLGSSLALLIALKSMGKKAFILCEDKIPSSYTFLPFIKDIKDHFDTPMDMLIALDCGNFERLAINTENYNYLLLINIDHHLSNNMYGNYNYVDTKASAVAEIVYHMIKQLNLDLNKDIAKCLYTSLLTDTGGFKHSNTTENTHRIAGELINTSIDFSELHRKIFEETTHERLKLYAKVFNTIELKSNKKICFMELNQSMIEENSEVGDSSDIISFGINIDSVEVAVLLKEVEQGYKVSLRSKNYFDVRKIAEKFQGGGHTKASGFSTNITNKEEIKEILLKELEKEMM